MLLLADEPTGALDRHSTAEVLDLFDQLNAQGRTVVVITHEEEVADARQAGRADARRADRQRRAAEPVLGSPPRVAGGVRRERPGERSGSRVRGVTANKMRSALTTLGILIGVAAVIILVAVGTGSSVAVQNPSSRLGSNTLTVRALQGGTGGRAGRWRRAVASRSAAVRRRPGGGAGGVVGLRRRRDRRSPQLTLADADALTDTSRLRRRARRWPRW